MKLKITRTQLTNPNIIYALNSAELFPSSTLDPPRCQICIKSPAPPRNINRKRVGSRSVERSIVMMIDDRRTWFIHPKRSKSMSCVCLLTTTEENILKRTTARSSLPQGATNMHVIVSQPPTRIVCDTYLVRLVLHPSRYSCNAHGIGDSTFH